MTANLLLSWSAAGYIHLSLSCRVGSYMNNQTLRHLTFVSKSYRYICLLHDCECFHSHVHHPLGARDKGKNPRGDTMVLPVSSSFHQYMQLARSGLSRMWCGCSDLFFFPSCLLSLFSVLLGTSRAGLFLFVCTILLWAVSPLLLMKHVHSTFSKKILLQ